MKTSDVLKTARGLISSGRSASTASFGDWPDAVAAFQHANRWRLFWLPRTRRGLIRALDRAIVFQERAESQAR